MQFISAALQPRRTRESTMTTTATITVLTTCTCGAARWFSCTCATVVAEYDAPLFDDMRGVPAPAAVAWVERQHPGCSFRYLKVGSAFDFHLEAARRRLAG
jgi:hypothetical protein